MELRKSNGLLVGGKTKPRSLRDCIRDSIVLERKGDRIWWFGEQTRENEKKKLVTVKKPFKGKTSINKELIAFLTNERDNNRNKLEAKKENNKPTNLSIKKEKRMSCWIRHKRLSK